MASLDTPSDALNPPRRVVVAGGSGFIGQALCRALLDRGDQVTVLSRGQSGRGDDGGTGPLVVRWQPGDTRAPWRELIEGADAVINLCGAGIGDGRWTDERKQELLRSRVEPAEALTGRLPESTRVYVQASGVGYYGIDATDCVESTAPGSDFLAGLARAWEAPARALAERPDAPRVVIARFGVVLGRSGGALGQMLLPFRLGVGGPIAGGRQWLSWIHLDDAVRALLFALESEALQGPVNVTAPEPVRNADFARAAGRALRRPSLLPLPGAVLRAALGEQASLVTEGQQALPAALEQLGFRFRHPDIATALATLVS